MLRLRVDSSALESLALAGSAAELNATLATLRYRDAQDHQGDETLTVVAREPGLAEVS